MEIFRQILASASIVMFPWGWMDALESSRPSQHRRSIAWFLEELTGKSHWSVLKICNVAVWCCYEMMILSFSICLVWERRCNWFFWSIIIIYKKLASSETRQGEKKRRFFGTNLPENSRASGCPTVESCMLSGRIQLQNEPRTNSRTSRHVNKQEPT